VRINDITGDENEIRFGEIRLVRHFSLPRCVLRAIAEEHKPVRLIRLLAGFGASRENRL
jgi:hypothetical protein